MHWGFAAAVSPHHHVEEKNRHLNGRSGGEALPHLAILQFNHISLPPQAGKRKRHLNGRSGGEALPYLDILQPHQILMPPQAEKK